MINDKRDHEFVAKIMEIDKIIRRTKKKIGQKIDEYFIKHNVQNEKYNYYNYN